MIAPKLLPIMHSLGQMAKALNRPAVYLQGLQERFDLPRFERSCYSDAYLAFLRALIFLRTLNVAEENLCKLWHLEKKLLTLIHLDSIGSPTWFLDACGPRTKPRQRLLLTNFNMGFEFHSHAVQLGLNFSHAAPELFAGTDMGEDELRVLAQYLKLFSRIQSTISSEIHLLRDASRWGARFSR
jgi:hypothetical protein